MDFEKLEKSLKNNLFEVSVFEKKEEATKYLNEKIDNVSIGFGGSVTVEELNLYNTLSTHNTAFSHAHIPEGKTQKEIIDAANTADVYITSANAVTYNFVQIVQTLKAHLLAYYSLDQLLELGYFH